MKKILYGLTIFISLFIATQNVEAWETCYYRDSVNDLNFYATKETNKQGTAVGVQIWTEKSFKGVYDGTEHRNGDHWDIQNWDNTFGLYNQNENCPKYLVYDQVKGGFLKNGDDAVYFTDNPRNKDLEDIISNNTYILENYEKNSSTPVPTECPYSEKIKWNGIEKNVKIVFDIKSKTWEWFVDDVSYGSNKSIAVKDFLYISVDTDTKTQVESNDVISEYTLFEYANIIGQCPTYRFYTTAGIGSSVLMPAGTSVGGSEGDTKVEDNYEANVSCKIQFSHKDSNDAINIETVDLLLEKGIDGTYRMGAKYEKNENYNFSANWNTPVSLNTSETDLYIQFLDEETANYYKVQYLDKGVCPEQNDSDIFINRDDTWRRYTISREGNGTTTTDPDKFLSNYTSFNKFKNLLEDLKTPLEALAPQALNYTLELDGNSITLSGLNYGENICKKGKCNEPRYQTEQALRNVKTYCNEVGRLDPTKYDSDNLELRKSECDEFNIFYDRLVSEGIVSNLAQGCGFISEDLRDKLNWILDIIKIAAPILAVVLGMLDFVKVLVSGDPDKGMKDAWKKFQTRLIAAVLLFLVPFILEILITTILPEKYIDEDPFCYIGE